MEVLIFVYIGRETVCIWSDVLGILKTNRWVKEIRNIGRRSKKIMLSYLTQIWLSINSTYLLKM